MTETHTTKLESLISTIWPKSSPEDSDAQHRKVIVVRCAQGSAAFLVVASVVGAIVTDFSQMSLLRLAILLGAGVAYIVWNLLGTQNAVQSLIQNVPEKSETIGANGNRLKTLVYFGVQLSLAALIYALGDQGQATIVLWLVLLPPIAHAVLLLPRWGIAVITLSSVGILAANVISWHGWARLPYSLTAFSFAVLFTLVFTWLAASSERSRSQVLQLASQLQDANVKLREYAVQAEELASTRERNRLAREIHDSLGHYLTVVNVQIEAARALCEKDPARAASNLAKAQNLTQEGLEEIRRSISALRTSPLDHKELSQALQQIVRENNTSGLPVTFQVAGAIRVLSPQAELTLYRAGQEGLTNARKHAKAKQVCMTLDYRNASHVLLRVEDDGAGANAETLPSEKNKFGLLGLKERVVLLGGDIRIQTRPGTGFSLEVEVPG